jgi:protoporphyrinogen oxidase
MVPYNSRLWGVSPRDITAEWCGRFLPIPSLEDVVAGAVGLRRPELGYNARFLYPRKGIGDLSEAMSRRLAHLQFCRRPLGIDWRRRRIRLAAEEIEYQVLVNTAPLPVLCRLLDSPPPEVVEGARRLRHTSLYYLDVALASRCLKDVHWVYVPESKYPFYRVGCYSHFSGEMAPPGTDGLYVELAEREPPRLDQLLPEVAEALVSMRLIASPGAISFARVRKLDYAYVIFDHDYSPATSALHAFLADEDILSTGRYGGWNYSSMEDALRFGRDAARAAAGLSR